MKLVSGQIQEGSLCILGIPIDQNSSFRKGPSLAPEKIRQSYFSDSSNLWSEMGLDLEGLNNLIDLGDIDFKNNPDTFGAIQSSVKQILDRDSHLIALGGDHSVTFPIIEAHALKYDNLNILHLDAHPDLYETLGGKYLFPCLSFCKDHGKKTCQKACAGRHQNPEQTSATAVSKIWCGNF